MERNTLKIKANTDNVVKFLYDTPIEGTNNYRMYHLYAFEHGGEETGLFATDALHEKLRNFIKGDSINIRKEEYEAGKFGWNVVREEGTPIRNTPPPNSVGGGSKAFSSSSDDRTKDIHRQVCLKLAVQSMGVCSAMEEEFNYGEVKDRMEGLLNVLDGIEPKNGIEPKGDLPF